VTRKINYKHCENCITLVTRIKELESFTEWVNQLDVTRYDEIKSRVTEVLETEGDYYA